MTIHAHEIGDKALVTRQELEELLELARRSEPVALQWHDDDLPTVGVARLAEQGGAFDFWKQPGEDIYTLEDGEPV